MGPRLRDARRAGTRAGGEGGDAARHHSGYDGPQDGGASPRRADAPVGGVRAISIEITRELDLGRLLELIVRRAGRTGRGCAGAVILWDDATQSLVPRSWHGCGDWIADTRGHLGEGLTGTVALRRQGMLVNDYAASPYASLALLEHVPVRRGAERAAGLPGSIARRRHPVQCRAGKDVRGPAPGSTRLLAAQAAIAIENARLFADGRRSYHELQRAQEQLIQTEKLRALGQMSAGMAHDLNNVLAAVLGQVELLQMQIANPDVQDCLRTWRWRRETARISFGAFRISVDGIRVNPWRPSAVLRGRASLDITPTPLEERAPASRGRRRSPGVRPAPAAGAWR